MPRKIEETASALYARFQKEANVQTLSNGDSVLVWKGKLVDTILDTGIPYGSYRRNVDVLEQIGAIQVIARGTRGTSTIIVLLQPPTEELWAARGSSDTRLTQAVDSATLMKQAQEILDSLGGLDGEAIKRALVNLEGRMKDLENRVNALENVIPKESNGKV
jgi:hypothetical protein